VSSTDNEHMQQTNITVPCACIAGHARTSAAMAMLADALTYTRLQHDNANLIS